MVAVRLIEIYSAPDEKSFILQEPKNQISMNRNDLKKNVRAEYRIIQILERVSTFPKKTTATSAALTAPITMFCHEISAEIIESDWEGDPHLRGQICLERPNFDLFKEEDFVVMTISAVSPSGSITWTFNERVMFDEKIAPASKKEKQPDKESPNPPRMPVLSENEYKYAAPTDQKRDTRYQALNNAVLLHQYRPGTIEEILDVARQFEDFLNFKGK